MTAVWIAIGVLTVIGLLLGIGLGLAAHFMAVKENEKAVALREMLPGANCGGCGFSGCAEYAAALAESPNLRTNLCPVGGDATAKAIAAYLGSEPEETVKKTARVLCRGTKECRAVRAEYVGVATCRAAKALYSGGSACVYGCLGFGDCVTACDTQAISIRHGVAVVSSSLCLGCARCVGVCPQKLITLLPEGTPAVLCRNTEKGAATKAACGAGCVGCRMCEKACAFGAITMDGGLARIDSEKCTGCGACLSACKFGVISLKSE